MPPNIQAYRIRVANHMKVITGIHFGNHDMKIQESIIRVQNRHQDMNYNWNLLLLLLLV